MIKLSDEVKQELLIICLCLVAGFFVSKIILYYSPKPKKECVVVDSKKPCVSNINDTKS